MKLDIQKFATGTVELNVEKEYTYEQEKISSVKVTVIPISNGEDFENDFVCSIDDDGWTSIGSNGAYYKVFTENVDKIVTFTYDGPARFIGEINLTINDIYDFYDLTICIDKQPMHNPSSELREYTLKLLAPLRSYIDVADQFILDSEGNYKVVRNVEKYLGSLRRLPTPIEETIGKMNIELFEGDNYVYLKENGNYLMKIQYLTNSEMNKTYATKMEMNSRFNQTVNGFNLIVSKKVDNDEIISTINQSAEQVQIDANKISLKGKTINLTSENIEIDSTNFKVDKNGNMTCTSGTFAGTVNTDTDLMVGNNAYIGRNQSGTSLDRKYLYFSDNSYIQRTKLNSTEVLSIKGGGFATLESGNSSVQANGDSVSIYTNNYGGSFYMASFNPDNIYFAVTPNTGSDERLKQNINDIDVSWINDLKVKEFEYKKIANKKQIGLIAQDYVDKEYSKYFLGKSKIQEFNNETREMEEQEYHSINYGNITNALIKYCQELKQEIEILKEKVGDK